MSGQIQSGGVDISVVSDTSVANESGIEHAALLTAFADAVIKGPESEITEARDAIVSAMGYPEMVDAAGVIGNFQRMNRIADGMGLELDAPMRVLAGDVGDELGLGKFVTAANTKPAGAMTKMFGKLIYPLVVKFFRPPTARK